jgi:hypothetical protein
VVLRLIFLGQYFRSAPCNVIVIYLNFGLTHLSAGLGGVIDTWAWLFHLINDGPHLSPDIQCLCATYGHVSSGEFTCCWRICISWSRLTTYVSHPVTCLLSVPMRRCYVTAFWPTFQRCNQVSRSAGLCSSVTSDAVTAFRWKSAWRTLFYE